jgi:transposase
MGYTRKRSRGVVERTGLAEERLAFAAKYSREPQEAFVSVDETAIYVDMKPSHGYAPRGARLSHTQTPRHRTRMTLLLAISTQGVVLSRLLPGSAKGPSFAQFINDLAAVSQPRTRILLDNASIHKTRAVQQAARSGNAELVYLPPYTPQFQPVEHCFSVLKSRYRRMNDGRPHPEAAEDVGGRLQAALEQLAGLDWSPTFASCWRRMADRALGS